MGTLRRFLMVAMGCLLLTGISVVQADQVYEVPGVIAYVGDDYNVYTLNLHEGITSPLTVDADATRHYVWPTWATNGRLAYFCCDSLLDPQPYTEIYVSPDGVASGNLAHTSEGGLFTHAYWSPRDCAEDDGCRDLAVLLSLIEEREFGLDVVRSFRDGTATAQLLSEGGAPFYYSWSPEGGRLLTQRNAERVDIYSFTNAEFQPFEVELGLFPAPQWSPVDDRLLVGLLRDAPLSTDITILANDDVQILRAGLAGEVAFNWSPDGNYIAYRTFASDGVSSLIVLDAVTGETIAQTVRDSAYAFFWSPDSKHIAFISLATPPGSFSNASTIAEPRLIDRLRQEEGLRWSVLDVESNTIRMYASFIPTSEMLYLLGFFNQFAQSHSLWSPDSTHIVFSEVLGGESSISILDTTRQDAVPFSVAEGVIGIWSYR